MRINTNVSSLNAQESSVNTSKSLANSLEKLSSGLRINKASDDASGLAIADKLRTQATSINQGISNGNSAITLLQIADKSMAEQSNILDTVKSKLIQANTDTTSSDGRESIRKDIAKLLEQLDNIAEQTNYNGKVLLQASATSQVKSDALAFQIGETKNDIITNTAIRSNTAGLGLAAQEETSVDLGTIKSGEYYSVTIGGASSKDASGNAITAVSFNYKALSGDTAEDVYNGLKGALSGSAGASALVSAAAFDAANPSFNLVAKNNNETLAVAANVTSGGVLEDVAYSVSLSGAAVTSGLTTGDAVTLTVGSSTYSLSVVSGSASTGATSIQAGTTATGIADKLDAQLSGTGYSATVTGGNLTIYEDNASTTNLSGSAITLSGHSNASLTLTQNTGTTGVIGSPTNSLTATITTAAGTGEALASLKDLSVNGLTKDLSSSYQAVIDAAITDLNSYRGDIGSTQNQAESAVRNLMTQATNVKAAESIIRDVDYAAESANFNKQNIISQAGSYAISQANSVQQNVLRLLQ